MIHNFKITGIQKDEIQDLLNLNGQELLEKGISTITVDEKPGFPCRISLVDADIGEKVLAFSYEHHRVKSPYQSSGPIFLRTNAKTANLKKNEIPKMLIHRLLSLRIYDEQAMMIDARTLKGEYLKDNIQEIFANEKAKYIHVHNSSPGCYNCQINRI